MDVQTTRPDAKENICEQILSSQFTVVKLRPRLLSDIYTSSCNVNSVLAVKFSQVFPIKPATSLLRTKKKNRPKGLTFSSFLFSYHKWNRNMGAAHYGTTSSDLENGKRIKRVWRDGVFELISSAKNCMWRLTRSACSEGEGGLNIPQLQNYKGAEAGVSISGHVFPALVARVMALWFTTMHSGSSAKCRAIFTPCTH